MPLFSCAPKLSTGIDRRGFLPLCRCAASMPHPCGLFPPKAPVLGAAYGRKTVAIVRIALFTEMDDIQKPSKNFFGVRIMTDIGNSKAHSTVRSSPRDATENVIPHWNPTTELDAICRNVKELRHRGASEEAITTHFGEQLQAITARQNKETAEVVVDIYASQAYANGFVSPKWNLLSIIALATVFAGFSLELTIGNQFVFSAANQYRAAFPWLTAFLAIISAWIWFSLQHKNHIWAKHYPTWWVRWLLVFPGMVATSSIIVAISPLGWLALYGWIFGSPTEGHEAKMLSVAAYHSGSRGCHQNAEIIINGNSATVCLDKAISGRVPAVGEAVTVAGRISRAGVFVDEIRAR
ncbi:hypothetical protein [Methylomonas fluvii]|nr:hypothetical protein [Methylomonas fluvii]